MRSSIRFNSSPPSPDRIELSFESSLPSCVWTLVSRGEISVKFALAIVVGDVYGRGAADCSDTFELPAPVNRGMHRRLKSTNPMRMQRPGPADRLRRMDLMNRIGAYDSLVFRVRPPH